MVKQSPTGSLPPTPIASQILIDAEGWRPVVGGCPSRYPTLPGSQGSVGQIPSTGDVAERELSGDWNHGPWNVRTVQLFSRTSLSSFRLFSTLNTPSALRAIDSATIRSTFEFTTPVNVT